MFKKQKQEPLTYEEKYLLEEIALTKNAIETAYSNFENAVEPDLIDCYIYQLNSEQKRYKYLLERAKAVKVKSEQLC
ncbi:MAG: YaaL family protein [Bacteroides sp.]|nr:YaaL family protein [Clostridia bacterium]